MLTGLGAPVWKGCVMGMGTRLTFVTGDPRTAAPCGELAYATVGAPTILEADLAAKLLVMGGKAALSRLDDRFKVVVTDRGGRTEVLAA